MGVGIHRIEVSQNQGDGIIEMSSLTPSDEGGLLKPLGGELQLKFDKIGSVLTTECLISGEAIQEGASYKLSARTLPGPLVAPSSLAVSNPLTAEGVERVEALQLGWDSQSGGLETGFGIERSVDGVAPFVQIDTVGTGIETYTDDSLSYGDTRFYQVRALGANPSDYSNIDSGTVATNGLIFTNPIIYLRSDRTVLNGSQVAQYTDLTAQGRSIYQTVSANQALLGSPLDGHDGVINGGFGNAERWLDNSVADWGTPNNPPLVFMAVVRIRPINVANTQQFHFSRNDTAGGDLDLNNCSYTVFSGTSSNIVRFIGKADPGDIFGAKLNDRENGLAFDALIMFEVKSNTVFDVYVNGVLEPNVSSVAKVFTDQLNSFIMFKRPDVTDTGGVPLMVNWETLAVEGDYAANAQEINDYHDALAIRYPSLGIVSPNL